MRSLLDVDTLIALLDENHVHHADTVDTATVAGETGRYF